MACSEHATGDAGAIELTSNVSAYFQQAIHGARTARALDASDAAETYLVALLVDFARPQPLAQEALERPLTLLYAEARAASGNERFERLRTLGDAVLYVGGFFGEHLEQRGVALDYVADLGARAYDDAGRMLRRGATEAPAERSVGDVFAELAAQFKAFVRLVADVADGSLARAARSDGALLRVYERWLKTGSHELERALWAGGLTPARASGGWH